VEKGLMGIVMLLLDWKL